MLNYVWSFLLITGIIAGALFGRLGLMVNEMLKMCKTVVLDLALPLAGTMMLFLGVMRVMEKAGLMKIVGRVLAPILTRIFPDVPKDHPAIGSMTLNIAANMLGLGNAATPLGLKAMSQLQELNPHKQSATNAMCMFLVLNTAGFALIPMGSINYLSAAGVPNPQGIVGPTILVTLLGSIMGVLGAMFLQRLPMFRAVPDDAPLETTKDGEKSEATETPVTEPAPYRMSRLRLSLVILAALGFSFGAVMQFLPAETQKAFVTSIGVQKVLDQAEAKRSQSQERAAELKKQQSATPAAITSDAATPLWRRILGALSNLAIPALLIIVVLVGLAKGLPVYEEMVEGAKEGFGVATRIMPFLLVMMMVLSLFRESGALVLFQSALQPVLAFVGMPVELFPLAMMRPLSGSGSAALLNDVLLDPGSSLMLKYSAAILYGSTETTFYVLAVYFGSVSVRRTRHALAAGLWADLVGMSAAIFVGWLLFSGM